ncbi:hypothetical protein PoB_000868700 [Plakobranchus ocellatus]|uniref:C2H2-type domain-containing protein n=1 Tax=Plakobranchus ocellatus TaxID=259542 RepID=A0AAV3YII9_9GAST|nr:hypothetical protein PoB_000868700 [Plakobranchus ocellatus]
MTMPHKYSCPQCDFTTSKEKKLSKHVQRSHPKVKNGGVSKKKSSKKKSLTPSDTIFTENMDQNMSHIKSESSSEFHNEGISKKKSAKKKSLKPNGTISDENITMDQDMPDLKLEPNSELEDTSKKKSSKKKSLTPSDAISTGIGNITVDQDKPDIKQEFKSDISLTPSCILYDTENPDSGVGSSKLKCPFCEKNSQEFGSIEELSEHKKSNHKEIVLNCCLCEFSSKILKKWHKHIRNAHDENMDALFNFLIFYFKEETGL